MLVLYIISWNTSPAPTSTWMVPLSLGLLCFGQGALQISSDGDYLKRDHLVS